VVVGRHGCGLTLLSVAGARLNVADCGGVLRLAPLLCFEPHPERTEMMTTAAQESIADLGNNECSIPFARDYIHRVQQHGAGGKKRKPATC
jgi:hypothetical protein